MPDLKLLCDNCGSSFALSFNDDEVSYSPSHCPFCGDFYDTTSDELNFNEGSNFKDEDDDLLEDDWDLDDDDDEEEE
jgi:hypothetical protein